MRIRRIGLLGCLAMAATLLSVSTLGSEPSADGSADGDAESDDALDPEVDYLLEHNVLLPRRKHEVQLSLSTLISNNLGEVHYRGAIGAEVVPWLFETVQTLRPSVFMSLGTGYMGDREHGGFSVELGGKLRGGEPWFDGAADIYGITGASLILSSADDGRFSLRTIFGVGARVMRALSVEATANPLFGRFVTNGKPMSVVIAGGGQVSVDFCSLGEFCDYQARRPKICDHTCELYDLAHKQCIEEKDATRHEQLCDALDEALATQDYARTDEWAIEVYFRETARWLKQANAPPMLSDLRTRHTELRQWWKKGRHRARQATLAERVLAETWRYSPYPVPLRRALGCEKDDVKEKSSRGWACPDVCDVPSGCR